MNLFDVRTLVSGHKNEVLHYDFKTNDLTLVCRSSCKETKLIIYHEELFNKYKTVFNSDKFYNENDSKLEFQERKANVDIEDLKEFLIQRFRYHLNFNVVLD